MTAPEDKKLTPGDLFVIIDNDDTHSLLPKKLIVDNVVKVAQAPEVIAGISEAVQKAKETPPPPEEKETEAD